MSLLCTSKALSFSVFLVFAVQLSYGLPHGAPSSSCRSMTPGHPNSTQPNDSAPYSISAAWSADVSGAVEVTLSGDASFIGYLLMAHMEGMEEHKVGKFFSTTDGHLLDCDGIGEAMAVTHANGVSKTSVKILWIPNDFLGEVVFRATVVKDMETYWTKVDSSAFNTFVVNAGSHVTAFSSLLALAFSLSLFI